MAKETLYDVLGVKSDATEQQLKSAWREQTRRHHPDTGDGDREALEKIQRAYKVLSDSDKRKKYNAVAKILSDAPKKNETDSWGRYNNLNTGAWNIPYTNRARSSGSAWSTFTSNNTYSGTSGSMWFSSTKSSIYIQNISSSVNLYGNLNRTTTILTVVVPISVANNLYGATKVSLIGKNGKIGNIGVGTDITDVVSDPNGTWYLKTINIYNNISTNAGVSQEAYLEIESI